MKRIVWLLGALLLASALLVGGCAPADNGDVAAETVTVTVTEAADGAGQEVYKWRVSQDKARGSVMSDNFVNYFCKPIEEASGGRIEIENFAWGELVSGKEIIQAVAQGTLDISNSATAYHPDWFASTITFGVAGGLTSADDWQLFYYDYGYRDFLQEQLYGPKGVYLLGPQVQPGQVEFLKEEISSFKDIKGMKLRSFGANGAIYGAFGASITDVAISEAYEAVATGVVDGGTVGEELSIVNMSLQEVIACAILEPRAPSSLALPLVINLDLWNSLPDDLKAVIHEVTVAYGNQYFQKACYGIGEAKGIMKEAGVTFYEPTADDLAMWDDAVEAYWADLEANPLEEEALGMLKDFMGRMGYL